MGDSEDILLEILSHLPFSKIRQLRATAKSSSELIRKVTNTEVFWKSWVINSLFPRHDDEVIESIKDERRWFNYALIHAPREGSKVYVDRTQTAEQFYPLYSGYHFLSKVKHTGYFDFLLALREGEFGFIAGNDVLEGKWVSYPNHQIEGEPYVNYVVIVKDYKVQICLLTKLGRIYRMRFAISHNKSSLTELHDIFGQLNPMTDIEGLGDSDNIVVLRETDFLTRQGLIVHYRNYQKCEIQQAPQNVIQLEICTSQYTYGTQYFSRPMCWTTSNIHGEFLMFQLRDTLPRLPDGVETFHSGTQCSYRDLPGLFAVGGVPLPDYCTSYQEYPPYGAFSGLCDLSHAVLALPSSHDEALRRRLEKLSSSELDHLTRCCLLRLSPLTGAALTTDDLRREFLLREYLDDFLHLLPRIIKIVNGGNRKKKRGVKSRCITAYELAIQRAIKENRRKEHGIHCD